jgi:hypothetical protein
MWRRVAAVERPARAARPKMAVVKLGDLHLVGVEVLKCWSVRDECDEKKTGGWENRWPFISERAIFVEGALLLAFGSGSSMYFLELWRGMVMGLNR